MPHPFPLTAANRRTLAQAFCHNPRVDLAIDSAVEGQMGAALVDDPAAPTAFCIASGPFRYYAGAAEGETPMRSPWRPRRSAGPRSERFRPGLRPSQKHLILAERNNTIRLRTADAHP